MKKIADIHGMRVKYLNPKECYLLAKGKMCRGQRRKESCMDACFP
jgi:hypothetical protein